MLFLLANVRNVDDKCKIFCYNYSHRFNIQALLLISFLRLR